MRKCSECGGGLKRVHRTFWQRFTYMAVYKCRDCERRIPAPRRYTYHFGNASRCPQCGTFRIVRLKERDKIDGMHKGFLNLMERLAGGRLYHCRYCRLQFWDRRALITEVQPPPEQAEVSAPPSDTAKSA